MNQKIEKRIRKMYRRDFTDIVSGMIKQKPWYVPKFIWIRLLKFVIR